MAVKKAYVGRECVTVYSMKGERVTAKVYMKHILFLFFTVKPTLLNINILHPKVSAVPSAQASPGPHAWSTLRPVCARPGPKITVSALHTNLFYISFVSDLPFFSLCMCVCVYVLLFLFFFTTQYLKSPAVKYRSLRVCFSTN